MMEGKAEQTGMGSIERAKAQGVSPIDERIERLNRAASKLNEVVGDLKNKLRPVLDLRDDESEENHIRQEGFPCELEQRIEDMVHKFDDSIGELDDILQRLRL